MSTLEINDNTKIGLYAALGITPVLVFAIFFIASIYFKAEAANELIDRQGIAIREQREMLIDIKTELATVKAILERIEKK